MSSVGLQSKPKCSVSSCLYCPPNSVLGSNTVHPAATTHSQSEPSCPGETRVPPSLSSAPLWSPTSTHVSVCLSPDGFQLRNVVPACYRRTECVFVRIHRDQIPSQSSSLKCSESTVCLSTFGSAGLHCAAQSTVTQSCKQTRSCYTKKIKFSHWLFSTAGVEEGGGKEAERKRRTSLKPVQVLALFLRLQTWETKRGRWRKQQQKRERREIRQWEWPVGKSRRKCPRQMRDEENDSRRKERWQLVLRCRHVDLTHLTKLILRIETDLQQYYTKKT